jgi:type IV pilus biogenesis protein CpaD/CtpE
MKAYLLAFACASVAGLAAAADAADLVRMAITTGSSSGTVDAALADESRRQLNATGPLALKVTRLHAFQQAGCARLRLDFTQRQALLPGTSEPGDYNWSSAMNICTDGQPPATPERNRK